MIRKLFWHAVLLIALCIVGSLYFLATTAAGLHLVLRTAAKITHTNLTVGSIEGNLLSPMVLKNIFFENSHQKIALDQFTLNWSLAQLPHGKITIKLLALDHLNLISFPEQKKSIWNFSQLGLLNAFISSHILVDTIRLNSADIHIQNARLQLNGELTNAWNIQWDVSVPDISQFVPEGSGMIFANGTISGERYLPAVTATWEGSNIMYGEEQIKKMQGNISLNLIPNSNAQFGFQAENILYRNSLIRND